MAGNRFTQVTGSTFQPLDLNEIMMVPLYKQKQENDAMLALDEFSKLEANSLDADKDYVSGQISAFQNESSKLAAEILERGVDRNLVNKVRDLRNRKNQELSIQGKTGQASAAFNQYQANKKQIMARKDLTDQQKILGLQRAQEQYKGVLEDDMYQDYAGASFVDIMKRGRDILKEITPQEKAKILGMDLNADGSYNDGIYIHETLKPEHIQKIVKQALQGDDAAMNYLREVESLGLGNVEDMLNASAVSAGNIGQVDIQKGIKFLPKSKTIDDKKGIVDSSQAWSRRYLQSGIDAYNKNFEIDEDFLKNVGFSTDGSLPKFENFEGKKMNPGFWGANTYHSPSETSEFKDWKKNKSKGYKIQESIAKIRRDNPAGTQGKTDKEVFDIMNDMKTQAALSYSEVIKPINVENSFYHYSELITGTENRNGDYVTRGMKIMGKTLSGNQVNYKTISTQLDMDEEEFDQAMKKGALLGMVPSDPDYPMGNVVQIRDNNGDPVTLILEADANITETYPDAHILTQNMVNGTRYMDGMGYYKDTNTNQVKPFYKKYVVEINPRTNKYERKLIRSATPISNEEMKDINIDFKTGKIYLNSEYRPDIQIQSYQDVLNVMSRKTALMYDSQKTRK